MRRSARALTAALLPPLCAAAVAGCGGSAKTTTTSNSGLKPISTPYCASGCAKVNGRVEECGGPSNRCRVVGFVQVALLDLRGHLVTAEHSGSVGPRLRSFSLLYPGSGMYTVETRLIGEWAMKMIRLRRGRTLTVNLVIPIW